MNIPADRLMPAEDFVVWARDHGLEPRRGPYTYGSRVQFLDPLEQSDRDETPQGILVAGVRSDDRGSVSFLVRRIGPRPVRYQGLWDPNDPNLVLVTNIRFLELDEYPRNTVTVPITATDENGVEHQMTLTALSD